MGPVFILDLFYASGVALSPTPVMLVIVMLFSGRARNNSIAYLAGWTVGLFGLGILIFFLARAEIILLTTHTVAHPLVMIVLGVGLVLFGKRQWERRKTDPKSEMPKWLDTVEQKLRTSEALTPGRAFTLGILISVVSPKNIALMLAAVFAISEAGVSEADSVVLVLLFIIISSLTVGIPVLYALYRGSQAQTDLEMWKTWLIENRKRFSAAVLVGFGVFLIVKGAAALIADFMLTR